MRKSDGESKDPGHLHSICTPTGKMIFTKVEAKRLAKSTNKRNRGRRSDRPVEEYQCNSCRKWHIGKRPPKI